MSIDKLNKLWAEYKKIKEHSTNLEHSKKNLKQLENSFGKFIEEESKEKGYADGGAVLKYSDGTDQPVPTPSDSQKGFFDSLKAQFNPTPSPTPDPEDERQQNYNKIRKQNSANFGHYKGGKIKGYDDGGTVVDDSDDAMVQKYRDLGLLKGPTVATNDVANVEGEVPSGDEESQEDSNLSSAPLEEESPINLSDVSEKADPEDKEVEEKLANEEFEAEEKADDDKKEDKEDSREPASKDEEKSEEDEDNEDKDQEPQDEASRYQDLLHSLNPNKYKSSDLADAQRERDTKINEQKLQKGAALIGAGIARTDPSNILKGISQNDKYVNLPIQKYQEQVANQQNDPNSPMSAVVKQYMTSKGIKVPDDTSAADLFKVAPFLQKDQALQTAMQKVILQQQSANARSQQKSDSAAQLEAQREAAENKRAADKNAIEKQKADSMGDIKQQAGQDRALAQTKTMLESARGNPAAAQAEKDMYSVDKVNSLFKLYPDPNKIPQAQTNLIISEISKIAQGGVPTGHEIDALKPNTPESKLQQLWGQVTNQPTPANLGAYLNEFKKYTSLLKDDAQKVIKDKYGRVIESSKKQLGDDNYKALQDQYLNRFNTTDEVHPKDSEAIEWAKANSSDPRAVQILKVNGIN